MSSPFNPDRSLLNPKFEGYKLDPLEQAQCARSYPLLGEGATQSTVSSQLGSQPSFKEVQSRISFNHLFAGFNSNEAAYVDKSGNVILVNFDFASRLLARSSQTSDLSALHDRRLTNLE
jgi:hypothetical protein